MLDGNQPSWVKPLVARPLSSPTSRQMPTPSSDNEVADAKSPNLLIKFEVTVSVFVRTAVRPLAAGLASAGCNHSMPS